MPDLADLYSGYAARWIDTTIGKIFARVGGSGPPLLLLHGHPQSNVMWHHHALSRISLLFSIFLRDHHCGATIRVNARKAADAFCVRRLG
jgi:haloacetate dehalogenase